MTTSNNLNTLKTTLEKKQNELIYYKFYGSMGSLSSLENRIISGLESDIRTLKGDIKTEIESVRNKARSFKEFSLAMREPKPFMFSLDDLI